MKSYDNGCGYFQVWLYKDGIHKQMYVHRLVAQAFIPNPNNLPQVNHKDEVKTNNAASNLEWMSLKDNNNYGTRNQRVAEALRGRQLSDETREKISKSMNSAAVREKLSKAVSEAMCGLKFWNNGQRNKRSRECPGADFVLGRLRVPKQKQVLVEALGL